MIGVTSPSVTALLTRPGCGGAGVKHWYCCDENLSWCLLDISDQHECPPDCGCQPCVVCEAMEDEPCPGHPDCPAAKEAASVGGSRG